MSKPAFIPGLIALGIATRNRTRSCRAGLVFVVISLCCAIATAADPTIPESRTPFRGRSATTGRGSGTTALRLDPVPSTRSKLPAAVRAKRREPPMVVQPIDRERRPAVNAAALEIDRLLAGRQGAEPSSRNRIDDGVFLRRVWLELGGRIPTLAEAAEFSASKDPDKRHALIDRILESPDWVSRFYNVWADTLRLGERPRTHQVFDPYLDWVKRSIAANRRYDEWVREMLTADGKIWDNPAVGYQLRDQGMPLPYVDLTVRVFLGTRIGCAQCHDHPTEPWTQRQFYELAAFSTGTVTGFEPFNIQSRADDASFRRMTNSFIDFIRENQKRSKAGLDGYDATYNWFLSINRSMVGFRSTPLTLPHDYRYSDGEAGAVVAPGVPWGEVPPESASKSEREQFADWVTSRENRQFARTVANRLWKVFFGLGIVDPVDDFREGNSPSRPELLEHLTDLVLELDFDIREFVRIVVSTDAWQRPAQSYDPTAGEPFSFRGPVLRRMSAEQLWDSILTLVSRDLWAYQRPSYESFAFMREFDLYDENPEFETGYANYQKYLSHVSRKALDKILAERMSAQLVVLARASELPLPLPPDHLLRQFGQGDRETVDGSSTTPTIVQVLTLFHGYVLDNVLAEGSVVMDSIATNDSSLAVDIIFLSVLCRRPTVEERQVAIAAIKTAPSVTEGYRDVIWALLNTREFLFIQ